MKVLIIPSWYPTDDNPINGIFFKEQALSLKKYGCDVAVLYPEIRMINTFNAAWARGLKIAKENGIETYRYKGYNPVPRRVPFANALIYDHWLKKLLKEYVRKEGKPDIIHAHSCLWGGWAAAKIARSEKIPFVVTEHSSKLVRGLLKPYEKREIRNTLNMADKIISVGPSLKAELEKYTTKEILEIPNIVDYTSFQIQTEHLLPDSGKNKFRFFSLAFLSPNKGMDVLISSFAKAFKKQEAELVIGGDGMQKQELMELTNSLNISDQVTFLGELNRHEVVLEMHRCDCFVLASRFETFGVVLIEALASGKPVISTKSGGPNSIVHEQNGLLVPVDDVEELSKAMVRMHHHYSSYHPDLIRKDCAARFSEEVIVGQLLKIYRGLK